MDAVDIAMETKQADLAESFHGENMKFMSFHVHLRRLMQSLLGSQIPPLEDPIYTLKQSEATRAGWGANTINVSKLPSSIQLKSQRWRHVDYVEFETPDIV